MRALAEAAGADAANLAAVRLFDRRREGRRPRNEEWRNPHDPDAMMDARSAGST
ncbi:MAG: hypothetical protein RQ751_03115 [Longimicrobiales bacterium]|nr:hypothetical protein [Longimicrobiales bacterium]